jgi:hypothetical protein
MKVSFVFAHGVGPELRMVLHFTHPKKISSELFVYFRLRLFGALGSAGERARM